jgi:hypothetical protein
MSASATLQPSIPAAGSGAGVVSGKRRRGRPCQPAPAVKWLGLDAVSRLLRCPVARLAAALDAAPSSFFPGAELDESGAWRIPAGDLRAWLRETELRPVLRVCEVARLLKKPKPTVSRWIERGIIAGVLLPDGDVRVTQEAYFAAMVPVKGRPVKLGRPATVTREVRS